ncbi:unnamed protein product [Arctia plantaginis]|uniref:Uncharacterized protein n=1 Tax=Arctia plantaginis TaxID=874455 RepID=A0A8S1B616_ARCPL|nr:unnamed protein product [Arctia plantaginis]
MPYLTANNSFPSFSYLKPSYGRRDGEEPQMQENQTTITLTPIEVLDQYAFFTSPLTTKEKNKIKDIGFETAGETIHMIIRGMGPLEHRSTRQPFGGGLEQHIRTTTERNHIHLISTKAPPFDTEDQTHKNPEKFDSPMDDTSRAFKNKLRLGPL